MVQTQFVLSLNQVFILCTVWPQPLSGLFSRITQKTWIPFVAALCFVFECGGDISRRRQHKKKTYNKPLIKQTATENKFYSVRFVPPCSLVCVLPQGGGTCYFVDNFYRSPRMCPWQWSKHAELNIQYVRLTDGRQTLSARNATVALRGNNAHANSPNCCSRRNQFQNEFKRNLTA